MKRYLDHQGDALLTRLPSTWVQWFRSSLAQEGYWGGAPSEAEGHLWFEVTL